MTETSRPDGSICLICGSDKLSIFRELALTGQLYAELFSHGRIVMVLHESAKDLLPEGGFEARSVEEIDSILKGRGYERIYTDIPHDETCEQNCIVVVGRDESGKISAIYYSKSQKSGQDDYLTREELLDDGTILEVIMNTPGFEAMEIESLERQIKIFRGAIAIPAGHA